MLIYVKKFKKIKNKSYILRNYVETLRKKNQKS